MSPCIVHAMGVMDVCKHAGIKALPGQEALLEGMSSLQQVMLLKGG